MGSGEKKVVTIGSRVSKFIGTKATREDKVKAASMTVEFTLRDTLIVLCYLAKDPDPEISSQARRNLIPAARGWHSRPDRPELPEPIYEIVLKVIEKIGLGERDQELGIEDETVRGNIGLLGLGEMIQAVDHNNRTVRIFLDHGPQSAVVYTENGKVVGAVCGADDGLDALYTAFSWVDASFRYLHGEPGEVANPIKANTMMLVMDGMDYLPEEDPYDGEVSKSWLVSGHLKIMNIFEIAEIFEMNSKQTVCRLKRDDAEGDLFFRNGRIVNARLKDMVGLDAACHLLAWPNARFSIARGGEDVQEVIHVGMQNLIIEAMRLVDEGVTVDENIANELAIINELFEGRDLVTLSVLEKVRLVFSEDENAREVLEADPNPLVRKAVKVKISKTVHKYLNPATDHELRLKAASGKIPMSTTEKLVLLTYFSHDDAQDIKETAKQTLAAIDASTYKKGFGADLHPAVMDFLVRETVRDAAIIRFAAAGENLFEDTALFILDRYKDEDLMKTFIENRKLLERSSAVANKLGQLVASQETLLKRLEVLENGFLEGQGEIKVEGPLSFSGLSGWLKGLRQGLRSGVVVLESDMARGRVYVSKGKVIGALWQNLEGLPALEAALNAGTVKFRFIPRTYFHTTNLDVTAGEQLVDSATGPKDEDPGKTGMRLITGSFQAVDLYDVLTALEGAATPLVVSVMCEEGTGEIYRDRSRVLHAHVEGKSGPLESMASLLSWNTLRFMVKQALTGFPITVDKSLADFFTEAVKLIPDEMARGTKPGELPEWELSEDEYESLYLRIMNMGVSEKIKTALTGNKEARAILVRDSNKIVATAVVKSPKIQESEIEAISKSRQVSEEVLRNIASSKDWMKSYAVKLNLVSNSKTPLPLALKLLNHIIEGDLRKLAKSKSISSTVATQARRMVEAKTGH